MRRVLGERTGLPIYLSEYASLRAAEMLSEGPQSRYPAAARFFSDALGLRAEKGLAKVYRAHWLNAGDSPAMGLISWDGHRKALFNAFEIYHNLPINRVGVEPEKAAGVRVVATADETRAGHCSGTCPATPCLFG